MMAEFLAVQIFYLALLERPVCRIADRNVTHGAVAELVPLLKPETLKSRIKRAGWPIIEGPVEFPVQTFTVPPMGANKLDREISRWIVQVIQQRPLARKLSCQARVVMRVDQLQFWAVLVLLHVVRQECLDQHLIAHVRKAREWHRKKYDLCIRDRVFRTK